MIKIFPTFCCALAQLSADNSDCFKSLERTINELKEEAKIPHWFESKRIGGFRAVFCIISPGEHLLQNNLIKLGFVQTKEFGRRTGYPPGNLNMFMLTW